ncbi:hypothetical protein [Streptomyces sp. NPDC093568]|uniref:hypothetical protein n=1 Tax=Streptomyces sp. NPDC093568 TaxID=3366041 RepID=UPI0037F5FCEB
MAQDAEPNLRELIAARRAELEGQAEKLSQQLQEVRDELEELAVAERVARRLAEQLMPKRSGRRRRPRAPDRLRPCGAAECRSARAAWTR